MGKWYKYSFFEMMAPLEEDDERFITGHSCYRGRSLLSMILRIIIL